MKEINKKGSIRVVITGLALIYGHALSKVNKRVKPTRQRPHYHPWELAAGPI